MSYLTIVVPALNEELNIEATFNEIVGATTNAGLQDIEILMIDDCSADNTFIKMQELSARDARVRPYRNEVNMGLGGTYKRGITLAQGEYYMLVPGDNAWASGGLKEIIQLIGKEDIVIPYIVEAGDKGPVRKFLSKGFTTLVNVLFGLRVKYYNGIVVHKLSYLKKIKIETDSFAYQAEALIKLLRAGHTYIECGLNTSPRPDGKSKALKISNLVKVAATVFSLRLKYLILGDDFVMVPATQELEGSSVSR